MTIRVKNDRIEFTSNQGTVFTLKETGDGFVFDGVIEGTNIFKNGFQGTVSGYTAGGFAVGGPVTTIDKFPFATDSGATSIGTITGTREQMAGASSITHGYISGGRQSGTLFNNIEKFSFQTNSNSSAVGAITQTRYICAGQSSSTSGYTSGGITTPYPPNVTWSSVIDRYPFATDSGATSVGSITQARGMAPNGQNSESTGYSSGGYIPPGNTRVNTIDKFPFATDTNATDVGDLSLVIMANTGQSSTTHGYSSGGSTQSSPFVGSSIVNKFPFSSDNNAINIGNLTRTNAGQAGQSSTLSGYTSGGYGPGRIATIDRFPFSSDSNATGVGDLTQGRSDPAGSQN
jgi:hypothetical protein